MDSTGRPSTPDSLGDDGDDSARSALPFLIAAVVAVLAVIAVIAANILNPGDERVNDSRKVSEVVGQYYGARNGVHYDRYLATICPDKRSEAPTREAFNQQFEASSAENGDVIVDTFDAMEFSASPAPDGESITASFDWHFTAHRDTKERGSLIVTKIGEDWKVCE